jgi:hypothetical protein
MGNMMMMMCMQQDLVHMRQRLVAHRSHIIENLAAHDMLAASSKYVQTPVSTGL